MIPKSAKSAPRVFISYSHDSDEHAAWVLGVADRLCADGLDCVIDRYDPAPKVGWTRWMTRQIREADFVLCICTEAYYRRVMLDEKPGKGRGVKWEGGLILQAIYESDCVNEKFIAVLAPGGDPQHIPDPLRPYQHYRLESDEDYEGLYRRLTEQPTTPRPPLGAICKLPPRPRDSVSRIAREKREERRERQARIRMARELPADFVARPGEFEGIVGHLLSEDREEPTAIAAALRGAGGYGKTILATAVCHDPRINDAFSDGILWVTLGEKPAELAGFVTLHRALTGGEAGFANVEDASNALAQGLGDGHYLLVIDDVWNRGHVDPYLRGGPNCARLITTRNDATLPREARRVNVDAMQRSEAEDLLGAGLPDDGGDALHDLAVRLGDWPLLLKLVNAALHDRISNAGQSLVGAIEYVHRAMDKRGLTAFDADDPVQREQAVALTVGVSLDALDDRARTLYGELGVFPENVEIPLSVLTRLWHETSGLDAFDTEELCGRFKRLSLLSEFNADAKYVRLHDVFRKFLCDQQGEALPRLHRRLLNACRPEGVGAEEGARADVWSGLPPDETYLWCCVPYHLGEAAEREQLKELLLSYSWLRGKLEAAGPTASIADLNLLADDKAVTLLQGAVRLSSHVLADDQGQLAAQLLGRLLDEDDADIGSLLDTARESQPAKP